MPLDTHGKRIRSQPGATAFIEARAGGPLTGNGQEGRNRWRGDNGSSLAGDNAH